MVIILLKIHKKMSLILLIVLLLNILTIQIFFLPNYNNFNEIIHSEYNTNYLDGSSVENIKLSKYNNEINKKFNVSNMFPGDSKIKYYCINISQKERIKLKYIASIKSGYKEIDEVFKLKVKLINTNDILYNGFIKNIPETIDYDFLAYENEEICYEITASLDTNVGNEYQNKEIIINFKWIAETEELENDGNLSNNDGNSNYNENLSVGENLNINNNVKNWKYVVISLSVLLISSLLILKKVGKKLK